MPICDLCGNKPSLYKALIEGTELNVCTECSKFGKILETVQSKQSELKKEKKRKGGGKKKIEKETLQLIVPDYAHLIKNAREKLNLKQEDFAKIINEKQNLIHLIETGKFEPSISLARKLEKFLKIKLIEEHEEIMTEKKKVKADTFTIGDFIKVK